MVKNRNPKDILPTTAIINKPLISFFKINLISLYLFITTPKFVFKNTILPFYPLHLSLTKDIFQTVEKVIV